MIVSGCGLKSWDNGGDVLTQRRRGLWGVGFGIRQPLHGNVNEDNLSHKIARHTI